MVVVILIVSSGWCAEDKVQPKPAQAAAQTKPVQAAAPVKTAPEETPSFPVVDATYLIGPGDVLEISVWKDQELTRQVIVLPDGTITFPLVGLLKAAGRTSSDLKAEIEAKITQYIPEPTLNVDVKAINSYFVYVIGRVNRPDRFNLNANINVLQALASAGGLNPFAKRDKIKIYRQENGKTKVYYFDYDYVSEGKHLEQNINLRRGDVIVVP